MLVDDINKIKDLNIVLNDTITNERAQFREIVIALRDTNVQLSAAFEEAKAKFEEVSAKLAEYEAIDISTEIANLEAAVLAVGNLAEDATVEQIVSR